VEELHPLIADLLNLWRLKRPPGGVPHRAEFDVFTLRSWLGWLTVYEELDGGADFLVRLDGSNIVALTGDEWTGHRMSELNPQDAAPVLEVLRRTVREREPIVDRFYSPAVKDFLTFHRVTLPIWEDRRGVWQVIQGMHLAPGLENMELYPARGRADQLWCRHPAGTFL
jgi:PAS domain